MQINGSRFGLGSTIGAAVLATAIIVPNLRSEVPPPPQDTPLAEELRMVAEDGFLSKQELLRLESFYLRQFDANSDGLLSYYEMRRADDFNN